MTDAPDPSPPDNNSAAARDFDESRPVRPPHQLYYAPPLPKQRETPVALNYGQPSRYRNEASHPAVRFILGMLTGIVVPSLVLCASVNSRVGGRTSLLVFMAFLVGIPILLLFPREYRLFGAGWLTMLALLWLALFMICGPMNFR